MVDERGVDRRASGVEGWVAVVDDDAAVRTALARVMRADGISVSTFATAHEYLAASAARGAPSCVVLDVHLGSASRMSGFELHDHLVASGAHIPIILLTAHDEVPSAALARRAGPEGYLRKPFEGDALIAMVRAALRRAAVQ
jgi:FixJ family two-component response regulator